jgi:hypothetical protein
MQSNWTSAFPGQQFSGLIGDAELAEAALRSPTTLTYQATAPEEVELAAPAIFKSHFKGCMEMYAEVGQVTQYLDAHQDWFRRCAQPMQVEPIGENGYILVIGHYNTFGYEVEPRIGLDLLPQAEGVYRIQTIHLPESKTQGYQVDFQAGMNLVEGEISTDAELGKFGVSQLTNIDWQLDLEVAIQFPRFINRLPKSLLQNTGDRVLAQIVKQVSQCLMTKVQDDFHQTYDIAVPKKLRQRRFIKE